MTEGQEHLGIGTIFAALKSWKTTTFGATIENITNDGS